MQDIVNLRKNVKAKIETLENTKNNDFSDEIVKKYEALVDKYNKERVLKEEITKKNEELTQQLQDLVEKNKK